MKLLGKTNIYVNRVGFGGIPIQRITQEETNKVIDELVNNKINFIDKDNPRVEIELYPISEYDVSYVVSKK